MDCGSTVLPFCLRNNPRHTHLLVLTVLVLMSLVFEARFTNLCAAGFEPVRALIGPQDSIMVADPAGRVMIAKHEGRKLVPASILKIFTSLAALHYLGPDHRYVTEFYVDQNSNLKIKGYGDPLLISEVVNQISGVVAERIGSDTVINDILVDDTYFNQPLTIPGISSSTQPYDAPNGALCVNFNTVFFKRTRTGYASAESQTPLLPFAENKIRRLKPNSGRIVLSHVAKENTIYAGQLFRHFLIRHGLVLRGAVKPAAVDPSADKLVYRHVSHFTLPRIIAKLLEHSNNFTTNQLLISCGIKKFGPPGNLEKGVAALRHFAAADLQLRDMTIVEGSGISRQSKVSAGQMLQVLTKFKPHRSLMRRQGREYYKTGTLYGVNTRAGYIASGNGGFYRFVVMINTPGKSTRPVMRRLLKALE